MLQLNQINKVFNEGSPDEKIALKNANLYLNEGDFVTVIGSNGAGKSTLMNLISGKLIPDFGTVYINGDDVTGMGEH